jgi:hypothetical protein
MKGPLVKTSECHSEPDVLEASVSGYWPGELSAHVKDCPICGNLALTVDLLRKEHAEASREALVPTAGQVWWRATMRRRAEASMAAARPITLIQGVAGASAAGTFAAFVTMAWPSVEQGLARIASAIGRGSVTTEAVAWPLSATVPGLVSLALVVAAGLIVAPLVFYLVLSDE